MKRFGWICLLTAVMLLLCAASAEDKLTIGSIVTFGAYPQTKSGTDNTPIEWQVLDVQEGQALLISRYGLDTKPYNTDFADVTWETCALRDWLNGEFYSRAFSPAEQGAIAESAVANGRDQGYVEWDTDGGSDTQDRIFLLSCAEAHKYFDAEHYSVPDSGSNLKPRVIPTAYAITQGAHTGSGEKTEDGSAAGWWWLRSPGIDQSFAAFVSSDGALYFNYVFLASGCVRPAFWLNLDSFNP